ncbi:HlyD family type I secretion periplasmic adaptor subunit [Roseovarius arcticus]|uniref:HlyD family type I secretion periplasmic adaptor subunit n=1 Tax=Roseovarius arcticus TaxID=2547404 RepID=UPI00111070FB|nr:HlyD family type I secretion periplasmic adaptor subunit [Roseovarius arcticus]
MKTPAKSANIKGAPTGAGQQKARQADLKTGLRWPAILGGIGSVVLLVLLVLWAGYTQINGAVIATGQAVVRGNPKVVQSLDGGVVADIRVEDGDLVERGALLLSLDPTLLEITRDIYRNRLAEVVVRGDRLKAEHLGLDKIKRSEPPEQLAGLDLEAQYAGQYEIFQARRALQLGKKEQLRERIEQFKNQINGVKGQIEAKRSQLSYIRQELESVRALNAQGLARQGDLLELQRSEAALLGDSVGHQSELARIHNSIRDTQMEILQSDRQMMEEVVTEIRETTTKHEELLLEIVTLEKQLDRIDILAPVDGIVHESQVYTVGGVVAPESVIMQIIPVSEGVEFEVRVDPTAIDQIYIGQTAKVQFPAFDLKTAPILYGELVKISPNTILDQTTGRSYYRATVVLPAEELRSLGPVHLVPGMPVEAFMQTGERSVLDYLTKPLADQLNRAFKEG